MYIRTHIYTYMHTYIHTLHVYTIHIHIYTHIHISLTPQSAGVYDGLSRYSKHTSHNVHMHRPRNVLRCPMSARQGNAQLGGQKYVEHSIAMLLKLQRAYDSRSSRSPKVVSGTTGNQNIILVIDPTSNICQWRIISLALRVKLRLQRARINTPWTLFLTLNARPL